MKLRFSVLFILLSVIVLSISCSRGSGCPASQQAQKMVDINNEKTGSFQQKKKKSTPKSSVMPAEIRYGSKKKK